MAPVSIVEAFMTEEITGSESTFYSIHTHSLTSTFIAGLDSNMPLLRTHAYGDRSGTKWKEYLLPLSPSTLMAFPLLHSNRLSARATSTRRYSVGSIRSPLGLRVINLSLQVGPHKTITANGVMALLGCSTIATS